ncbi:MAG: M20 family metallopeptidase [Bacteroidota bacterium]|nr:M20 family metallopeptidase [Bacteroidota bacterium]
MDIIQEIQQISSQIFSEVVSIRRHLHQNPELSFHEFNTSAYICSKLTEFGIPFKNGFVKTGILARIDCGSKNGKTIALRADMDALPIQEKNNAEYCSINQGVMHACGHDLHAACLLGTAKILKQLAPQLQGTILLIFQPAEEVNPGGAKLMMEEGLFAEQEPDMIIGLHVLPELETGKAGFKSGMYMASGDEIHFKVKGQGGHGALPHKLTDTVLATAHIITSLQQIVSRNAPPEIPTVLSFGRVIANGATNIIPNEVEVAGTFRTMNEPWRQKAKEQMKKLACSIAEGMGATCEFDINDGYPVLYNDEALTAKAKEAAIEILGSNNVIDMDIRMTCEDFAYYSLKHPVTFFRIGVKDPDSDKVKPLHTSEFDVDENAILTGMRAMSNIAVRLIRS